jgi:hypothetical protein
LVTNIEGPRLETRIYPESEQVAEQVASLPEVRRALFETGMPAALLGGRYRADPRLTVLPLAGGGSVIRFGTSGLTQAVGVDVRTGNVLGVLDVPESPTILINTAVDLFTATVRGLFERFPYYGKNAEWTEIDSACAELREIVLTPSHPSYAPPHPGEQYCYRRGELLFRTDKVSWLARSQARFHDESGEEDLGNIDIFTAVGDHYYLEGDWGSVEIESSERPRFILTVT